jgi:hypothetical protein
MLHVSIISQRADISTMAYGLRVYMMMVYSADTSTMAWIKNVHDDSFSS